MADLEKILCTDSKVESLKKINNAIEEIENGGNGGFNLFDTKLSDHILTYEETKGWALQGTYVYKTAIAGERYGYPTFIETCINEKNTGTAKQVTLGSNTLTMYVNDNGHQYYDIADKSKVDTFFNTFGIADFYGVDEENECVFLPRNNYFNRLTTNTNYVNNHQDYGLPTLTTSSNGDHTHTRGTMNITGSVDGQVAFSAGTGAFTLGNSSGGPSGGSQSGYHAFNLDASRSWTGATSSNGEHAHTIAGTADTVQPRSSSKLLYYCVGNTTSDTSWVDVVTQVEKGVKDLEDKTLEGIERLKASSNALTETQITNCLLKVPQRINLDLTDGVLTLKAGSIVTIPNGVDAYNYVTISDDKTTTQTTDGTYFVFCLEKDSGIFLREINRVESGSTRTLNLPFSLWFDTNNNLVKVYSSDSTTYGDIASLPLGLVTVSNGAISSINQIFNGIGYIGSTIWVDKGIKGLIPNGRNEDGTLNNIEFVTNAVHTQTFTASNTYGDNSYWITSSGEFGGSNANIKYHSDINKVLYDVDNTIRLYCEIGRYSLDKGIITSFQTKQPFQALDYNDKPEISGWAMPSDKYIDLTLGASGSFYTAPANGYVAFQRASSGSSQQLGLGLVNSVRFNCYSSASSQLLSVSIPVRAGQSFFASYQGTGETSMFRFIYAQGEV